MEKQEGPRTRSRAALASGLSSAVYRLCVPGTPHALSELPFSHLDTHTS